MLPEVNDPQEAIAEEDEIKARQRQLARAPSLVEAPRRWCLHETQNVPSMKNSLANFPELQAGDILLYGGGFVGRLIQFRTWSDVSHVEIYAGKLRVLASRSEGPREYLFRADGIRRVIRPVASFDFEKGRQWFDTTASKLPYGYFDLARFYLIDIQTKGLICSEFADKFFNHCDLDLFNPRYPEGAVCPRDYETLAPTLALQVWSSQ